MALCPTGHHTVSSQSLVNIAVSSDANQKNELAVWLPVEATPGPGLHTRAWAPRSPGPGQKARPRSKTTHDTFEQTDLSELSPCAARMRHQNNAWPRLTLLGLVRVGDQIPQSPVIRIRWPGHLGPRSPGPRSPGPRAPNPGPRYATNPVWRGAAAGRPRAPGLALACHPGHWAPGPGCWAVRVPNLDCLERLGPRCARAPEPGPRAAGTRAPEPPSRRVQPLRAPNSAASAGPRSPPRPRTPGPELRRAPPERAPRARSRRRANGPLGCEPWLQRRTTHCAQIGPVTFTLGALCPVPRGLWTRAPGPRALWP